MKKGSKLRGLEGFLGLVVAPVVIATAIGAAWWVGESDRLAHERQETLSGQAARLLARDLTLGRSEFASRAVAVPIPDPAPPAVQRALAGDTVSGLASSDTSLELTVVVADADGTVRMIREPFTPPSLEAIPTVTGGGMALYLAGLRVATTDPAVGPPNLDSTTLEALVGEDATASWAGATGRGVFRAVQPRPDAPPDLVLLVATPDGGRGLGWLAIVVPVVVIILALSTTAAWSITRSSRNEVGGTAMQSALMVFIPVLAGAAVLLALDRGFRNQVIDLGRRQLTESAALVQELSLDPDPRGLAGIFGYEAALVDRDGLVEATNGAEPIRRELAEVPLPPPNWMASGLVPGVTPPVLYESFRLGGGRGLLLFRGDLDERAARLRTVLARIGVVMALPAMTYLALLLLSGPAPTVVPERKPSHFVDISTRRRREGTPEDETS